MVVVAVLALMFFFGKDKVVGWAKGFGEAKREYEKASKGEKSDEKATDNKSDEKKE